MQAPGTQPTDSRPDAASHPTLTPSTVHPYSCTRALSSAAINKVQDSKNKRLEGEACSRQAQVQMPEKGPAVPGWGCCRGIGGLRA